MNYFWAGFWCGVGNAASFALVLSLVRDRGRGRKIRREISAQLLALYHGGCWMCLDCGIYQSGPAQTELSMCANCGSLRVERRIMELKRPEGATRVDFP